MTPKFPVDVPKARGGFKTGYRHAFRLSRGPLTGQSLRNASQSPGFETASRAIRALERLGFELVREREHVAMARANPDGSTTHVALPNHTRIKGSTLRHVCTKAGITRDDFLRACEER